MLVLFEDLKQHLDALHLHFRESKIRRGSQNPSSPLVISWQLQKYARLAEPELVVDEAKLFAAPPRGHELRFDREGVNHSNSVIRSAKKPFGQRSTNSPDSSTRS